MEISEKLKSVIEETFKRMKVRVHQDLKKESFEKIEELHIKDSELIIELLVAIFGCDEKGVDGYNWIEWWLYEDVEKKVYENEKTLDISKIKDFVQFLLEEKYK